MGSRSRAKGKRGEREIVHRAQAHGLEARRLWEDQSKPGGQTAGDVALEIRLPDGRPVYLEVRWRNKLAVPAWLREIEVKAPEGYSRALIFRRDREDWHVAIPIDDYFSLLKAVGEA